MSDSNVKKYRNLIKDTLVFSIGKIGSRAVLFFLVPLYTNYLSKSQYGTSDLVFTISQLLISVFSATIFDSVIRYGLMKGVKKENVLFNSYLVLGVCFILSSISIPFFSLFSSIFPWKYYLSLLIIIGATMDVEMNYLKVIGKNFAYSIISIIQALVLACSNIILIVFFDFGIDGYLLSSCLSYLSCVILALFAGHILSDLKKATFDKNLLKQMLMFSTPLILNNISWWVIQSSDKLMLVFMLSASALGLYTAASKIPSLIYVAVSVFQQAWGISSIKEIEDSNDTSFYSRVFNVYSVGVFFCCVLLNSILKIFMSFYVGAEFSDAWMYAPLLVVSSGFSAVSAYYGSLYGALKKSFNNMITTLIAAVINLIINAIFISLLGVWGAIIGTIFSYVFIAYIRMFDVLRYIKLKINLPIFIVNSIIVIIQALIISFNWHQYICSFFLLAIFIIINFSTIKSFKSMINNK